MILIFWYFRGTCPCSVGKQCNKPTQWCNCDDLDQDKWGTDDGYFTNANSLGITDMVFLQQPYLTPDALGRITLGPLECVETSKWNPLGLITRNHFGLDYIKYLYFIEFFV